MAKYQAVWVHKVEFLAEDDDAAHDLFWNRLNDGNLNDEMEVKNITDHGYVGFVKMESDGRIVEDSIMPDDVWRLKKD